MAEYTYKDVIIDPEDPRIEIGKEYYFANHVKSVLSFANIDVGYSLSTLSAIKAKADYPFVDSLGNMNAFIIRKKESKNKWVPFDLSKAEDRQFLRDRWIKCDKEESKITGFALYDNGEWDIELPNGYLNPKEMLALWTFLDGSPCGKLVEEE